MPAGRTAMVSHLYLHKDSIALDFVILWILSPKPSAFRISAPSLFGNIVFKIFGLLFIRNLLDMKEMQEHLARNADRNARVWIYTFGGEIKVFSSTLEDIGNIFGQI